MISPFDGEKLPRIRDLAGMACLQRLLRQPGKPVSCRDLEAGSPGGLPGGTGGVSGGANTGEGRQSRRWPGLEDMVDAQWLYEVRRREREIEEKLSGASDPAEIAELKEELDSLRRSRSEAVGVRDRPRQFDDKIRQRVRRNIKRAVEAFAQEGDVGKLVTQHFTGRIDYGHSVAYTGDLPWLA